MEGPIGHIERIRSVTLRGEAAIVDPLCLNELELKIRIGVDSTRTISRSTPSSCGAFLQCRTHYDTSHLAERIGFDDRASGEHICTHISKILIVSLITSGCMRWVWSYTVNGRETLGCLGGDRSIQ